MNVTDTQLDQLAAAAKSVSAAQRAAELTGALLDRGDVAQAKTTVKMAERKAGEAWWKLATSGLVRSGMNVDYTREVATVSLDTLDLRALLDGVAALVPLAEKVDETRGRRYPGHLGQMPDPQSTATDTKGTDLAETLHRLACRLHLELYGPSGEE